MVTHESVYAGADFGTYESTTTVVLGISKTDGQLVVTFGDFVSIETETCAPEIDILTRYSQETETASDKISALMQELKKAKPYSKIPPKHNRGMVLNTIGYYDIKKELRSRERK